MRFAASRAFAAVAIVALGAFAHADEKPVEKRNEKFAKYEDQTRLVTFKSGAVLQIDPDLPAKELEAILARANSLGDNVDCKVTVRGGKIIGLEKGKFDGTITILSLVLQDKIGRANDDDKVIITDHKKVKHEGQICKKDPTGIVVFPMVPGAKNDPNAPRTYNRRVRKTLLFEDIADFQNLTEEENERRRKEQEGKTGPGDPGRKRGPVDTYQLKVGDTIRIEFTTGQTIAILETAVVIREWKAAQSAWGEEKAIPLGEIKEIFPAALKSRRPVAVNQNGEVMVEEEKKRVGRNKQLEMRATISHDQKDYILVGATVYFLFGPTGNLDQRREVAVPAVFADEKLTVKDDFDTEDGQVSIQFDAKNLIPTTDKAAKQHIVSGLASKIDPAALSRVYAAAAKNGDSELALLLAQRYHDVTGNATDVETTRNALVDALQQFGDAGVNALLERVLSPDGGFKTPEATDAGVVNWKDAKGEATQWKKKDLKLLARLQGAASGERGRRLFDLFEDRKTEFGDAIVSLFTLRVSESIDTLLTVAISISGKNAEEVKRAEDAASLIRDLGEKAIPELITRVASYPKGNILKRQMEVEWKKKPPAPAVDIINLALSSLLEWKREERKDVLARSVEDAKARVAENKWEEALAIVADVLRQDPTDENARKVFDECRYKIAKVRMGEKKRTEAAEFLRALQADGAKIVERDLAQLLLESVKEDMSGVQIRRAPEEASAPLRKANKGEVFKAYANRNRRTDGWLHIEVPGKPVQLGFIYVPDGASAPVDLAQCSVMNEAMSPGWIRKQIEEILRYDASLSRETDKIEGELYLRDAESLFEQGKFALAVTAYDNGAKYLPDDPRLGNRFTAWRSANAMPLLLFAGGVVIVIVLIGLFAVRRQKRIRVAEFKYYGKDRARAERELDSLGGGSKAADEGAPADAGEPAKPA